MCTLPWKPGFWVWLSITTNANIWEYITKGGAEGNLVRYQTCYTSWANSNILKNIGKNQQFPTVFLNDADYGRYWIVLWHNACHSTNTRQTHFLSDNFSLFMFICNLGSDIWLLISVFFCFASTQTLFTHSKDNAEKSNTNRCETT